ncbi:MAG: hypothetical protein Q7S22_00960 [Candidatus Micrarchaeota archaeon]|nr:hypothetical protein [Candidatus Micrarchaeota archaeon]
MKIRKPMEFSRFKEIVKKPFRELARIYMLSDDVVWHGYDWIVRKAEEKKLLERNYLISIALVSSGIGFFKTVFLPVYLNEHAILMGFGFIVSPKVMSDFKYIRRMINNNGTATRKENSYDKIIRLAILAYSFHMMFFKDQVEMPNHLFIGVVGASVASYFYLDDSTGNGMIDRIREEARLSVSRTS